MSMPWSTISCTSCLKARLNSAAGAKEATSWRGRGRQIWNVTEPLARVAALMRTKAGRAATISVTDAIVVALAEHAQALILTSDPDDLAALAAHCESEIRFAPMWPVRDSAGHRERPSPGHANSSPAPRQCAGPPP
ncbi:MAG TPA: PIN domain-containing protein [Propionibacteriaceae bacterium]|nr:PIN domain-containing protein [Propionibacteriaceae bacterium]